MKQTKLDYSAPQAETFVVRFEGALMTLSGGKKGGAGTAGAFFEDEDINDYGDL